MDDVMQAAEANRNFSRVLREVTEGRSYLVTSHVRPVARIVPADAGAAVVSEARAEARKRLLARLAEQPVVDVGPWTRDELHER